MIRVCDNTRIDSHMCGRSVAIKVPLALRCGLRAGGASDSGSNRTYEKYVVFKLYVRPTLPQPSSTHTMLEPPRH